MSHFSELKDGSDISKVKVPQGCRNDGFFVKTDLYVEFGGADRLRSLFDQVLSNFLKGVCGNKDVTRAFPPKLGDGVEADLFTLFWVVRKIGDYELVSKNELWEFVAEECGLDITHVGSLKLIYIKYLKELDQWLSHGGFKDKELENGEFGVLEKLDSLFNELRGCKFSLSGVGFENNKKGKCFGAGSSDDGGTETTLESTGKVDLDMAKTEIGFSRTNNVDDNDKKLDGLDDKRPELSRENVVKKVDVSRVKGDDENIVMLSPMNVLGFHSDNNGHEDTSDNDNNTVIFAKTIVEKVVSSQKKIKDEPLSLLKMLDWVANAARNPHDVTIGSIPNSSKWKKYKSNEIWKQVLLARDTLFAKRNVDAGNKVYGSQKKRHMMHPSMYDDDKVLIHLSSKRIRCSQRVSSVKSCSCPGCMSCSSSRNKRQKPEVKKSPQILENVEIHDDVCEELETAIVTVGAEVPEWTDVVSESDSKWLGTQMWPPPEDNYGKHEMDLVVIGKGRQSSCKCAIPGSVDCVRFHIAENRTRVKDTLGPLFYKWKFNHMGEEASLSWSLEEETEFKSLVIKARQELTHKSKSRHEIMSNFWRRASESIPSKTKDILVSYYFNVFVLRQRSYQNRVMPKNIDSDDDELEVGSFGDRFGYEKIHALSVNCSKDMQCTDLES